MKNKGFTLIELLIVITIIVILSSLFVQVYKVMNDEPMADIEYVEDH